MSENDELREAIVETIQRGFFGAVDGDAWNELADEVLGLILPPGTEWVEEWKVTGDPGGDYPPYKHVWRGPRAEEDARAFMRLPGASRSIKNMEVSHRVVMSTPWSVTVQADEL